ncbi:homoserine kinase [Caulobacter sp. S45]|uniref:homoserine kinase n=1 Tax=Caulobacter sp. S45 TaxID=1641861 RepID=UPI001574F63C|nr:homoserine kinase [Caulobacter sp. S45]
MAVYTPIDEDDLTALLADFNLGPAISCKGIAEGVENSNFLLETERGRFILTLYERRVREGDLPYFLDLMRWLAERGFPCPTPMADRRGRMLKTVRQRPAALVSFLTGVAVQHPTPAHCREAGAGLARLHLAGRDFPGERENTLGQPTWAPLFKPLGAAADGLRPGLAADIHADLAALGAGWPAGLPRGSIHADLFPDNVFFIGQRFSAAIDFYFACTDALAYDLAICLNAWTFTSDGQFKPDCVPALITGYDTLRPLSVRERAALPVLARGAAMRFFLTRLADWGATPPGAMVRPKDPMEYEARLAFFRRLTDDPFASKDSA